MSQNNSFFTKEAVLFEPTTLNMLHGFSSLIFFVEVERSWSFYAEDERSYGSPKNKAFRASEDPKTPETLDISR